MTTGTNGSTTEVTPPAGGATPWEKYRSLLQRWLNVVVPPMIAILAVLAIWQLTVKLTGLAAFILPGPVDVVIALWKDSPILLPNTWVTLKEILIGLVISIFVGIPVAVVAGDEANLFAAAFE